MAYSRAHKRSWDKDERSIKKLKEFFGGVKAVEILPRHVENFIAQRKGEATHYGTPVRPATVNKELACLKSIFNKAIDNEKVENNPVKRVKSMKDKTSGIRCSPWSGLDNCTIAEAWRSERIPPGKRRHLRGGAGPVGPESYAGVGEV